MTGWNKEFQGNPIELAYISDSDPENSKFLITHPNFKKYIRVAEVKIAKKILQEKKKLKNLSAISSQVSAKNSSSFTDNFIAEKVDSSLSLGEKFSGNQLANEPQPESKSPSKILAKSAGKQSAKKSKKMTKN